MELNEANFHSNVDTQPLLLADFYATWCRPCHLLMPIIAKLEQEYDGIVIGKVNTEENPALVEEYTVNSIPTILLFKNKEIVKRIVGLTSIEALRATIESAGATKKEIANG